MKAVKAVGSAIVVGVTTGLATGNPVLGAIAAGATLIGGLIAAYSPALPVTDNTASSPSLIGTAEGRTRMIRSSLTPRQIIYGETMTSGPIVAAFSTGTNSEFLHLIIALTGHEVNSIGDVLIGDTLSTDARFTGFLRVNKHTGSSTQAADSDLVSEVAEWTSAHQLKGIAYVYVRLKWSVDVWLSGIPNIKVQLQGKKLLDIRDSSTGYSNNAALCQLDYLMDTVYGMRVALADIDTASWIAAADACDEAVTLLAGGTQKRYTCNGAFNTDKSPIDIIEGMFTASAGTMVYQQGKYYGYAGQWDIPVITLTDDDLRGPLTYQTKVSRREIYNAVKGEFIDEDNYFHLSSFSPLLNSDYETQDGGDRIYRDIELPFTQNVIRARRIAKIHLERSRNGLIVNFPAKLTAVQVTAWETIYLTISKLGWTNKSFRVLDWTLASEDGGINLVLQEDNSAAWGWSTADENTIIAPGAPTLPDPYTVAAPSGLTLTSVNQYLEFDDGTIQGRIKVEWTLLPNEMVLSGGTYEVQSKKNADSDWQSDRMVDGNINLVYLEAETGTAYDVRVRAANRAGVKSSFSTVTNHTVGGKTAGPATPTGLTATGFVTSIGLAWNNNSEADVIGYEIQRADDSGFSVNVTTISRPLSLSYIDEFVGQGVQRWYKIRAINRSGVYSSYTSTVNATTAGVDTLEIVDGAIEGLQVAIDAITNTKIEDDAITSPKILAGEVKAGNIDALAVTAGKIDTNSITAAELRVDIAIITTAVQMTDAVIERAAIKELAVDNARINNLTIATGKVVDNAITAIGSGNDDTDNTYTTEEVMVSATSTTDGGEVTILVHSVFTAGGTAGVFYSSRFRIREDDVSGNVLETMTLFCIAGGREMVSPAANDPSPPSGSKTYVFTAEKLNGTSAACGPSYMLSINYKK